MRVQRWRQLGATVLGSFFLFLLGVIVASAAGATGETVVINEIQYNPADSDPGGGDAEFIQLFNPGTGPLDVTGYTVDDGGSGDAGTTATLSGSIPAGGYVILTRDGFDAVARWGVTPLGTVGFGLGGGGDTITVRDASGNIVDEVVYDDSAPWPTSPDGTGSSLELINAATDNSVAQSWAGSIGEPTPGSENSVTTTPPASPISNVNATPFTPAMGETITVTAEVPGGITPQLHYVVDFGAETSLTMLDDGMAPDAVAGDEIFTAAVPGQLAGELVRYRITAPATGVEYPTGDDRNYEGVVVDDPSEIPTNMVKLEWFIPEVDYDSMFDDPTQDVTVFGSVLAVDGVVYDNMEVSIRGGTFARANLDKQGIGFDFAPGVDFDNPELAPYPIDEFALIAERGFTWLRDVTAWQVYYDAGFPEVHAQHVRMQLNGDFYGVFRFSEKLDGTWRDENDFDGSFYKADDGAFNNPATGFKKRQPDDDDLQPILDLATFLETAPSAAKTDTFFETIDIPNAVNMAAATIVTAHLDTELHNFYLAEDTAGTGLWEIYPRDLNFTWGIGVVGCDGGPGGLDDAFDELDLECVNNPYFDSIMEIPEVEEMVWRRVRTLLDGSITSGDLDALMNSYSAMLSLAERTADVQAWSAVGGYGNVNLMNGRINGRRDALLATGDVPGAQEVAPTIVMNELTYSPTNGVEFWSSTTRPRSALTFQTGKLRELASTFRVERSCSLVSISFSRAASPSTSLRTLQRRTSCWWSLMVA